MPVNYDDIAAIAHDTEHFSSRRIGVVNLPEADGKPLLQAPPITSDPPVHTWARRLLLPAFAPAVSTQMTPITRNLARELLESFANEGTADASHAYARHIPVRVIAHMLGVPATDEDMFTDWAVRILQEGFNDLEGSLGAIMEILTYFGEHVSARREMPTETRPDDVITMLVETEVDGSPLDEQHLLGTCFLLLIAGIDTTWSAIGSAIWHLATHPDDQARLRAEPDLIDSAVEEFLRVYSPVTMAREVLTDIEAVGCPMKAGDKVLMSFPAGNRRPRTIRPTRRIHHRPHPQPPLRIRIRNPPLPRLQPRPHGTQNRHPRMAHGNPHLRTHRPQHRHLDRRTGPRPTNHPNALDTLLKESCIKKRSRLAINACRARLGMNERRHAENGCVVRFPSHRIRPERLTPRVGSSADVLIQRCHSVDEFFDHFEHHTIGWSNRGDRSNHLADEICCELSCT